MILIACRGHRSNSRSDKPVEIITLFARRWQIEATFAERMGSVHRVYTTLPTIKSSSGVQQQRPIRFPKPFGRIQVSARVSQP